MIDVILFKDDYRSEMYINVANIHTIPAASTNTDTIKLVRKIMSEKF